MNTKAKHTPTVSQALGVCSLCGEKYEPSFTDGQHQNCPERIREAVPELLDAAEAAEIKLDTASALLDMLSGDRGGGDVWARDIGAQCSDAARNLRAAISKARGE